jgi:hypothetical protein
MSEVRALPKWCWSRSMECVVEILRIGHFPTSVMVRLPDGRETELEMEDLQHANKAG